VLWLHCECGGCCHHFDVRLQGTSCPLAEGYRELTRIVHALWMWWLLSWFVWGCKVQEVQFLWCLFGSGKFLKMCRWLLR
jgi:hypothetical protein